MKLEKKLLEKSSNDLEDKNKALKGTLDEMSKKLQSLEEAQADLKAENERLKAQVSDHGIANLARLLSKTTQF